jgi:peptide chain release factor 1
VKESLRTKLMELVERYEEVARLLSDAVTISDKDRFRELSKEYARLGEVAHDFNAHQQLEQDIAAAEELRSNEDPELRCSPIRASQLVERAGELERQRCCTSCQDPTTMPICFSRFAPHGDRRRFRGDLFRMYSPMPSGRVGAWRS